MSFFAGNKKIHVTRNTRDTNTLDSDTIYSDTVFHSNMKMLCSLGEYQTQAEAIQYTIQQTGENSRTYQEQAFQAAIPEAVVNAIQGSYVVLTYMKNYTQRDSITASPALTPVMDVPVSFPLNIKTSKQSWCESDNSSWTSAISPQITTGGSLDISYTNKSLKNAIISINPNNELDLTDWGGNGSRRTGWTADADYTIPGGKIPSCKNIASDKRYIQYHARHNRWYTSNNTVYSPGLPVQDVPYYNDLTNIPTPVFVFIVLNIRFYNGVFEFINPITKTTTPTNDIKLESGKVTVNGVDLTSLKVLVSSNPNAKGMIDITSNIIRLPVSVASYDSISLLDEYTWGYKMADSVNFTQGARTGTNNLPVFHNTPGKVSYISGTISTQLNTTYEYTLSDKKYTYTPISSFSYNKEVMGLPTFGNQGVYYRNRILAGMFQPVTVANYGSISTARHVSFALLDTSKFSGLYIDNSGIRGTFNGVEIPIYNTISPPTHMITGTTVINCPASLFNVPFEVTPSTVENQYTTKVLMYQGSLDWLGDWDGLFCVEILGESGTFYRSDIQVGDDVFTVPSDIDTVLGDDLSCRMYSNSLREYGLLKVRGTSTEIELTRAYITGNFKYVRSGISSQGTFVGYGAISYVNMLVVFSLQITSGGVVRVWANLAGDYGERVIPVSGNTGEPFDKNISMSYLVTPQIRISFTKIS